MYLFLPGQYGLLVVGLTLVGVVGEGGGGVVLVVGDHNDVISHRYSTGEHSDTVHTAAV